MPPATLPLGTGHSVRQAPTHLEPFHGPLGYLDFETVVRAVPVWEGLAPWGAANAQFSYHEERPDGRHRQRQADRDLFGLREDPDRGTAAADP